MSKTKPHHTHGQNPRRITTAMSGRVSAASHDQSQTPSSSSSSPCCLRTLIESLTIFPRNKRAFISILVLLTFPLSLLLSSLSLSTRPTKSQIFHLEFLARFAHTRFEARHVWRESRDSALSLLHLKLLYSIPSFLFSLLAAISTVNAVDASYHRKPITFSAALAAVKPTWTRPTATSICIYAILLLYSGFTCTLTAIIGGTSPELMSAIWLIGLGVEIYLMAVLGMGLVVSIAERRLGWGAIRAGSELMEGRRGCGWVLSCILVMATSWIGGRLERLAMDGEDSSGWTVVMAVEGWERSGLVGLYAVVVLWGYVVTAVFYCECKKRHAVRDEEGSLGV